MNAYIVSITQSFKNHWKKGNLAYEMPLKTLSSSKDL